MTSQLRNILTHSATVNICNESIGVFCQLLEPQLILLALNHEDNVGKLDDPKAAQAVTALHSLPCIENEEILIEWENKTNCEIRIRRMDEQGHSNQEWTIMERDSIMSSGRPGQLFLVSTLMDGVEHVLGAYRSLKQLPSGLPHFLLIEEMSSENVSFYFEFILTDKTGIDALTAAAGALDPVGKGPGISKTLNCLHKIVENILHYPEEIKFRKLKLSNKAVDHHIANQRGAMYLLRMLGFAYDTQDKEQYLVVSDVPRLDLFRRTLELLDTLITRCQPNFVAELAAPTSWQPPHTTTTHPTNFHTEGTHFITPDERWARTERWNAWRRHGMWGI